MLDRVRKQRNTSRQASPVAHASSSRPMSLQTNPSGGACRTRPLALSLAPGPQNLEVDEEMQWDPPSCIIHSKERDVRPRLNMGYLSGQNPMGGYCSRRPSPSPAWSSHLVGAAELGPWVGEPKPQGKTPIGGNLRPDKT